MEIAYVAGAAANRTLVQEQLGKLQEQIAVKEAKHTRAGNIGEINMSRQGGMLHDAMRAYIEWIKKDCFRPALGRVTDGGRTKMRQIENPYDPPREPAALDAG